MENFKYIARTLGGDLQDGISQAKAEQDVIEWLRGQGLIPVEVSAYSTNENSKKIFRRKKIRSLEIASFCWQLSTLLEGGIAITTAIDTVAEDNDNEYFRDIIKQIGEQIKSGETLHNSVAKFPKVFNKLFYSLIMAGETGGSLTESLNRLATYYEERDKLIRKVKGATLYPAIVVAFMVVLVTFIMVFIVPRFEVIFRQIGGELPLMTQMLMATYDFLKTHLLLMFLLIAMTAVLLVLYGKTNSGKERYSKIALKVSLLGKIKQLAFIVVYSRTLSTLLASGVSVLEALEIITTMSSNTVIKAALHRTREHIVQGSSISLGMSSCNFFPNLLVKMVQVGESSGSLPKVLNRTSEYFNRKVDTMVSSAMTILEPVLIIAIGLVVLVIVLALYLPIFALSDIHQ